MRHFRLGLALLILGLGAAIAAAQPAGLVTRQGREFVFEGKVFRFVGVNIRGLAHYGANPSLPYTGAGDIAPNLDGAASMGVKVIRFFAPCKHSANSANIARVQSLLDEMRTRGLKAIICLTDLYDDSYHPQGDDSFYMPQTGGYTLLDDTWFASGYQTHYLPWVESLVGTLKNHEAVFAWELGNELTDVKSPSRIASFAADMAARIKAIDPHHMVTTGFISVDHTQIGVNAGIALYANPNFDFMTLHTYNGDDPVSNMDVYRRLEIPLVVEEYGWSKALGGRTANTLGQVNKWFDQSLAAGFMQWGYQAGGWDIGDGDNDVGMDRYAFTDYNEMFSIYQTRAAALAAHPSDPTPSVALTGQNLALQAAAVQTDSEYDAANAGAKAIDGVVSAGSKWTSTNAASTHWIALDFGSTRWIRGYILRMAGDAGEYTYFDFKQYTLQTGPSLSGPWTDDFTISNPAQFARQTHRYPAPRQARCVRLSIAQSGIDNYARLPEFEVWGEELLAANAWTLY